MPTVLLGEELEAEGVASLLLANLRVSRWGRKIASIGDVISVPLDVEIEDTEVNVVCWPWLPRCLIRSDQLRVSAVPPGPWAHPFASARPHEPGSG